MGPTSVLYLVYILRKSCCKLSVSDALWKIQFSHGGLTWRVNSLRTIVEQELDNCNLYLICLSQEAAPQSEVVYFTKIIKLSLTHLYVKRNLLFFHQKLFLEFSDCCIVLFHIRRLVKK